MANLPVKLFLPAALVLYARIAAAQDAGELQKLYDDTLLQLQQSPDRKNQLANENAQLTDRVAALEAEIRSLRSATDRSEFMFSQYAAFRAFITRYPALLSHFGQYLQGAPENERDLSGPFEFYDRNWPFSAAGQEEGES